MQGTLTPLDEETKWIEQNSLEKILKNGLTDHDKEKEAKCTSIMIPNWIMDLLGELGQKTGISLNKTLTLTMKKGAQDMQNVEREYNTPKLRRVLYKIAYGLHKTEGDLILDLLEPRKTEIVTGKKEKTTVHVIWWIHGLLTKQGRALGIQTSTLMIIALASALQNAEDLTKRQAKEADELTDTYRTLLYSGWMICDAIIREFPRLRVDSEARSKQDKQQIKRTMQDIGLQFPEIYYNHFEEGHNETTGKD